MKRSEEKEENNQKERSKNKRKKKKRKKIGAYGRDRGGGHGNSYFIASVVSVVQWKEKSFNVGGPSLIDFINFWGSNKKQQCDGSGGGAQRPVWGSINLKKTGARSARARMRGQNPLLVYHIFI